MKKTYNSPKTKDISLSAFQDLLVASNTGGVQTGSTTGNDYNGADVSYGRRGGFWEDSE